MEITELKCKNCGAPLICYFNYNRATCDHCGSNYYLETTPKDFLPQSFDEIPSRTKINYTYDGQNEPIDISGDDIELITRQLCIIAGTSYMLKKNFNIKPIVIESFYSPLNGNFSDNVLIDTPGFFFSNKRPDPNYATHCMRNKEYIEKYIKTMKAYGLDVADRILKKSEEAGQGPHIHRYFDYHDIIATAPVITPTYFEQFFPEVNERLRKISQYPVIKKLASDIIKPVIVCNSSVVKRAIFAFHCFDDRCELELISYDAPLNGPIYSPNYTRFANYDMAPLDKSDFATYAAVEISLLAEIITLTQMDGKDVLGFEPKQPNYLSSRKSDRLEAEDEITLKYLIRGEETYNKW